MLRVVMHFTKIFTGEVRILYYFHASRINVGGTT